MPATQVIAYGATVPAGTAQSAPYSAELAVTPGTVTKITVTIPPGPSGLVGFQLWVRGGQVIPANNGGWIKGDDRVIIWELADLPETGAWQAVAYNTDINDHELTFEFAVEPIAVTGLAARQAQADVQIASALSLAGS